MNLIQVWCVCVCACVCVRMCVCVCDLMQALDHGLIQPEAKIALVKAVALGAS